MMSTVVRKWIVGLSGLLLLGFLIAHLAGNLTIYKPGGINEYADALHAIPLFGLAEIGLALFFVLHIGLVIGFVAQSKKARGGGQYAVNASKRKEGGIFELISAKAMIVSGLIVLGFLVVHLMDLRFARAEITDLEAHMKTLLSVPWRVGLYVAGSLLVAWHLYRGVQSGFRSIGFYHEKYSPLIHTGGRVLSIILGLGFASIPVYILVSQGG